MSSTFLPPQKDLIVLNDVHRVFAIDALASSHPLSSKAEDIQKPEQISELFDAISYSKVMLMLKLRHAPPLILHLCKPNVPTLPGSVRPQDAVRLPYRRGLQSRTQSGFAPPVSSHHLLTRRVRVVPVDQNQTLALNVSAFVPTVVLK